MIFQITRHIYLSLGHILNSFCLALCALRLLARIFYYTLYSALALPPLFLAYLDALSAYTDKLQCLSDGSVDEGFQWSWLSGSLVSCFVVVYIVLYVVYIVYTLLFGSFPVMYYTPLLLMYLFIHLIVYLFVYLFIPSLSLFYLFVCLWSQGVLEKSGDGGLVFGDGKKVGLVLVLVKEPCIE